MASASLSGASIFRIIGIVGVILLGTWLAGEYRHYSAGKDAEQFCRSLRPGMLTADVFAVARKTQGVHVLDTTGSGIYVRMHSCGCHIQLDAGKVTQTRWAGCVD